MHRAAPGRTRAAAAAAAAALLLLLLAARHRVHKPAARARTVRLVDGECGGTTLRPRRREHQRRVCGLICRVELEDGGREAARAAAAATGGISTAGVSAAAPAAAAAAVSAVSSARAREHPRRLRKGTPEPLVGRAAVGALAEKLKGRRRSARQSGSGLQGDGAGARCLEIR